MLDVQDLTDQFGNNKHPSHLIVGWFEPSQLLLWVLYIKWRIHFPPSNDFIWWNPGFSRLRNQRVPLIHLLCILMVPFNLNPWMYIWMCWFFDLNFPIFQLIASVFLLIHGQHKCPLILLKACVQPPFPKVLHVSNTYTGMCSMYIHRINANINMCVLCMYVFFLKATRVCELLRPPQTQPTKSGPWDGSLSYLVGGWTNPP